MTQVLIVAHGSPSDPEPPEAILRALAKQVGAHLPGATVRAATLAKAGSLDAALAAGPAPIVYPFFMAEGWFTRTELPRRLAGRAARILPPFGVDPALPGLLAEAARQAAEGAGFPPESGDLMLVAHGSRRPGRAKDAALAMADRLRPILPFGRILTAFIEEPPFVEQVARSAPDALCLPFFALRAGHVDHDIPDALRAAGFTGTLMPAAGEQPEVAALIAHALLRQ